MVRMRVSCSFVLVASLLAGSALSGQAPPGKQAPDVELFGKSLEVAQGAIEQYGLYDNPAALARVNELGYRVAAQTGYERFPVSFYLIDMAEPNAFALPGGQIFVTRGMLELDLSDDALAALLGHEIGHVVGEHNQRMQRRATLLNVLSQALLVGVMLTADRQNSYGKGVPDPYGLERQRSSDGDLVQGTYAASLIVSELLLASYSRNFEDESDEQGQRWAAAAGFDPLGTRQLMDELGSRLPQSKEYGYWRTHPFFDERVAAARARGADLKRATDVQPADPYRQATQANLLTWAGKLPPPKKPLRDEREGPDDRRPPDDRHPPDDPDDAADRPRRGSRGPRIAPVDLVQEAALSAWPQGESADRLRTERLHEQRDRELAKPALARKYGALVTAYDSEIAAVTKLAPESPFLALAQREREELAKSSSELYPEAQAIWRSGVFEMPFLEIFLANYPTAAEVPEVSLVLGDAYSRLSRQGDAVERYLAAVKSAPESTAGQKARAGLRALAPRLDQLAALAELAADDADGELQRLARERLAARVGSFTQLADGAELLRKFPDSEHGPAVGQRMNVLAQNLYGQVLLYQGVGDTIKALDGIQQILTYAPTSPAATKLRERVAV